MCSSTSWLRRHKLPILGDARFEIHALRHARDGHFPAATPDDPCPGQSRQFAALFGGELLQAFHNALDSQDTQPVDALGAKVVALAEEALNQPCCVLQEEYNARGKLLRDSARVITRAGLILAFHQHRETWYFCTMYFATASLDERQARVAAIRQTLRPLLQRGSNSLLPPDTRVTAGNGSFRTNHRLRSPEMFGVNDGRFGAGAIPEWA